MYCLLFGASPHDERNNLLCDVMHSTIALSDCIAINYDYHIEGNSGHRIGQCGT